MRKEGKNMDNPYKKRFQLWIDPNLMEEVENLYQKDGSRSRSEFIGKAIRAYISYVLAKDTTSMLPNYILSNINAHFNESDTRHGRMMFKLAVELAMVQNLMAAQMDLDEETVRKLRYECINEVKRLNGGFTFEDAVSWQSE